MTIHKKEMHKNVGFKALTGSKTPKICTLFVILICALAIALGTVLPVKSANAMQSGVTYSQIEEIWNEDSGKFNADNLLKLLNQLAGSGYSAATDPMAALQNIQTRLDGSKNDSYGTKAINPTAATHYSKQVTSHAINQKNGNKDIVVTFGGLKWTVTYLSYTKDGEPIATLWLADPTIFSKWSDGWFTQYKTTNMTMQSNLYGQSYIRSETLNAGSKYTTVTGATKTDITSDSSVSWVENKQSYENAFAKFTIPNGASAYDNAGTNEKIYTGSLTEFLETPRNVSWQEDQSWHTFGNVDYSLGNESWGDPWIVPGSSGAAATKGEQWKFYYYSDDSYDFRRGYGRTTDSNHDGYGDGQTPDLNGEYKIQYTDWADDYLWLPSLSETGYCNNAGSSKSAVGGVWYPSQAQRKCFDGITDSFSPSGSNASSWLRSGSPYHASRAYYLAASGLNYFATVSSVAAVRPALHLNLKSAASAARGFDVPSEPSGEKTYTGSEVKLLEGIKTGIAVEKVEFKRTNVAGDSETSTLTASEYTVKADGGFYATNAGEYTVTFKLTGDKVWNGTSVNGYGNPCDASDPYANDVIFWEVESPPDSPQGATDPRITNKTATVTLGKATPTVTDVKRTETSTLYTDGVLPQLISTGTSGTVTLDSTQTLSHTVTTYTWTFVPDDQYNYTTKTGSIELSVKFPLLKTLTATFDATAYNDAVTAGSAQKIYSSTPIANLKGIIASFVTVKGTKEDGKEYTKPIQYTLSLLSGKTKLDYGTSTVVLSFKDTDMTYTVSCELSGIPVIAVELEKIVLSGSFKNVYSAYETFDPTDMVVTAYYNDSSTKTITTGYTLEYADSRTAFWAGDTSVKVKYSETAENANVNNVETTAAVTVNKIDYTSLSFEDVTVPYDGNQHSVTVDGLVDGKMTVAYTYGGITLAGRTNAGTYEVKATVTFTDAELLQNYNTLATFTANLVIEKVDYDNLTLIAFNNAQAEFIGQSVAENIKAINLPEGVTVTYEFSKDGSPVNAADVKNVGVYDVTAKFTVDGNHKDIADKSATLTVKAKTLLVNNVSGIKDNYAYMGTAWTVPQPLLKVILGTDAVATNLVKDTDYTVTYSTEDGKADTTVIITIKGIGNYAGEVKKQFDITKATLNLTWNANEPQYDGNEHPATLQVTGGVQTGDTITTESLAALITVSYKDSTGAAVTGVPVAVGVYMPSFTGFPTTEPYSNYNYVITNGGYTYEIKTADVSGITFESKSVDFDGKVHKLEITAGSALPSDITPKYYVKGTADEFTGATNAGAYEITVKFTSASGNYAAPADMDATLTITAKTLTADDIGGIESSYVYKGEAYKPVPSVNVLLGTDTAKTALTKDRDFTVAYSTEDYNAGTTVTVTVTGIGNYGGSAEKSFDITKATLGVEFTGLDSEFIYNGVMQGVTASFTGVAESDKATVKPTVKYVSADGITYPESDNLPVNAGMYVIKVTLDSAFTNYEQITEITKNFDILKATPVVQVAFDGYDPDADIIYAGGYLPTLKVVAATFGTAAVTGSVDWQLVDGDRPLLTTTLTPYTWEFTPTGDDAVNFNTTTGTISLYGQIPGIAGISVEWKSDINPIPTLYTSATLDELRNYITVKAVLDNGMAADDEITDYTLKGSWGAGVKPARNATEKYDITVVSTNGKTAVLADVQYYKVELIGLEVNPAAGGMTTAYDALTEFDKASISVTALYNDGSQVTDITDYDIIYPVEGESVLWAGNNYVIVSYKDDTVANAKQAVISGLTVTPVNYDLTGVVFVDTSIPYDGNEHAVTVTGLPADKMTVEYKYDGAALADGVNGMVNAGSYTVSVTVTYTDEKYTVNYNALVLSDITLTIEKIDYDGVEDITFNDVAVDYNYGASLADALVAENVPAEVGVAYSYAKADGTACTADDITNAGTYKVTVTYTVDGNHKDIPSSTKTLTVNKIDPTINPTVTRAITGQFIIGAVLKPADGDTPGTYKWDNQNYILQSTNSQTYTFTPNDTTNYNVINRSIAFVAETKVLTAIIVNLEQNGTEFYTSGTIEDVKKAIAENKISITVIGVYADGSATSTQETITSGYELYLPGGATNLSAGDCAIGVKYGDLTYEYSKLTVKEVELASINATFTQNGVKLYTTPDDIETLKTLLANGTVTLDVSGTNNDGKTATEEIAYTLSGDWSTMTADGNYAVTVTVDGTSITTTFDIDVTVAAINTISAVLDQKDAKIYTSTTLEGFKQLVENGDVGFVVKAHYNNGKYVEITAKTDAANGYTLAIDGDTFSIGGNVNVRYEVNGTTFTTTFVPVVTQVAVDAVSAVVNAGEYVYTDTALTDLAEKITVTAYRNDGTQFTVATSDFSLTLPDGATKLTAGAQKVVNVTYTGSDKSAECAVYELITGVFKHATQILYTGATEFTYTGSEQAISSGATVSNPQTPTISYTIDGADAKFTDVPASGSLVLKISSSETDDYYAAEITVNITVNKANPNMSAVLFEDQVFVYDATTPRSITVDTTKLPAGVTVSKYVYIDNASGTTLTDTEVTNAGKYTVTVEFAVSNANYNAVSSKTATLTINRAEFNMDGVAFDDATYPYDGSAKTIAISGTLPAGVEVDSYTYVNTATGSTVSNAVNAGEYKVTVSFKITAADAANYKEVPDMTAKITITKVQSVIDVSGIRTEYTYDGSAHTVTGAVLTTGETGAVLHYSSNATFTSVPAGGKLTVTVEVNDSTNYIGAKETVEITVKKAKLTITAKDKTIFYGDAPANDGIKGPVGLVNGETVGNLRGTLTYTYDYALGGNVGNGYKIFVSGLTSDNYDITFENGKLIVLAKSVNVDWEAETYTYDGNAHAPTASFTGIDGDKVVINVSVAKKDGTAVAGIPVEAGEYVATASSANDNYSLTGTTKDFTINKANIKVSGEGDQFFTSDATKVISLDAAESGVFKFISLKGRYNIANVTIKYSAAYTVGSSYPAPEDDTTLGNSKPTFTTEGNYVVNYSIVAPNHNEYRGKWTVEVIGSTEKIVTIIFNKPYSVEFGEVPETAEELAALMETLVDDGYISVEGIDKNTFLSVAEMRLSADNSSSADSQTEVGRYTPYFSFKDGSPSEYDSYSIVYKTASGVENTNIGKFEIAKRELNISWDSVGFVYDGETHLPKATISGFKDGSSVELVLDSASSKTYAVSADGKSFNFTVAVHGDLTSAGGHTLTVSVDNENYTVDVPSTTISITPPVELNVKWDKTSFVYDGETHLPKATISGFAGGRTFEFTLRTADGGVPSCVSHGVTITFTAVVSGSGNKLTDVGVYAVSLVSNSENYVIKNPTHSISVTAPRKLVVTWNQTIFESNGNAHLPKALVSGFKDSDPVTIELKNVNGGVFTVNVDGKSVVFTVSVDGFGNLLKDVGNYTVSLTVDSKDYVIDNPDVSISVRELIGKAVEQPSGKITPVTIGILVALAVSFIMAIVAIIVAAKRKGYAVSDNDGGFNDLYEASSEETSNTDKS